MFDIPNRIRFLKTHHNGDTSLAQESLLTSGTNLQWQEILNDLLLGSHHYSRKNKAKNYDTSFPLNLGKEKYRKIFYSKVLIKNT
ncbi:MULTISPECIES: hypothetical protein [unclassified Bartonella]|uniref:hypothetical protein n=1 Tax=unclassified Bartonella TaxID=2645622 RepID=UPI00235EB24C|nr:MULTISPECIES: hypothetical protein [unclassified Bartonella]